MPTVTYTNVWGAARAKQVAALQQNRQFLFVLAPDQRQAELFYNELKLFENRSFDILLFPEYIHEPFEEVRILSDLTSIRTNTLNKILNQSQGVVITTPYALLKKIQPPQQFMETVTPLKTRDIFPREELVELLDRLGYIPVEVATGPGEYCLRGGIVDLFPVTWEQPVRLEYFDDEIELIFSYNAETQKKIKEIEEITLYPASEILLSTRELLDRDLPEAVREKVENFGKYAGNHWLVPLAYDTPATIMDYMPENTSVISLSEEWETLLDRLLVTAGDRAADSDLPHPMEAFATPADFKAFLNRHGLTVISEFSSDDNAISCKFRSIKSRFAFEKSNIYHALSQALREIKALHGEGYHTIVAMESERFIKLLEDFCRDHEIPVTEITSVSQLKEVNTLYIYKQRISGGFSDEAARLVCITDEEIFGFIRRRNRPKPKETFSTTISDLEEGDFVVHIDYGIGIYKGLRHMVMGGLEGDYLEIVYENNEILYVPLEQISQIQKYIGIGDAKPRLSSLQSANWSKLKASARAHAARIAQDLLKLYAERKARKGFSFRDDGSLLLEFEERFPYDETEDQLAAILDVYKDMENDTPMERLVCGDVGFGKTEVAMRAAFKAVASGKQVAVLVPTTVLARQHYNTFSERFKDFPVRIDYVSRFRSSEEIKKIKNRLPDGDIDILIGTHRLLSQDLHFSDLGLLVIDEEQRFGVAHKEKIAAMRTNIDVLALSATPIPRTLQLSLSGIRDISIIETPPENRLPVAVKVIHKGEDLKKAMVKELERGGQIFFLHNRIKDIHSIHDEIKRMVPHARVAVAHGQTDNRELEKILKNFYEGEIDILISTTIIENGIDIPNVNAIIIDDAAHFGLSQIYQLKGRVGRGSRRGYCYLLVDNFNALTPIAKKRLSIIQQLSELGSGLKIAMYDLQLRGAGDILGAQQSGFVTKVGYELFLKMIAEAVAELQQIHTARPETEIITQYPHYISADYIEDPRIRLDYYRAFSAIQDRAAMETLFNDLAGEYGELKEETLQLGYIMLMKNLATQAGITKAGIYPKMLRLTFPAGGGASPSILTELAGRLDLKCRFAGEYEFVLSFNDANETLLTGLAFLELLMLKLKPGDFQG